MTMMTHNGAAVPLCATACFCGPVTVFKFY